MKKIAALLTIFVLAVGLQTALAADKGTKEEAVAMVKKAVAFYKANGRDKAFAEFNKPKGQFVDRDLYVFVGDMQGKCLAHCVMPAVVGKDMMEVQDPDGRFITKERLEMLRKNNSAWQTYKYLNPKTKKVEPKSTYMERVGDIYIGVGVYQ
ncbi:MAG: cache domain-containing protein [Thermodesulfobacteriota bacterium]